METKITVGKYLSEEKDQIIALCSEIIDTCDKIHVKAPVGSGKTTMIIELIKLYPKKRFIVLFPQISITEQVKTKLTALNIESSEVNSKTIDKVIEKNASPLSNSKDTVFLSTIDSAYKLIDDIGFSKDETVVIVDETHTFLTSARKKHTLSVETILKGGFPIIGFSATPSTWVTRMLFGIENFIEVTTTKVKNPVVTRISVKQSSIRTMAYHIAQENKALTVVFTGKKKTQKEIQVRINEYNPNITVCCLNADTNKSTEEETWDYLMKNDQLPNGINVFIINGVAQSGINIKNPKIDTVYLFGTFDPFGFAQYLGRCRKYKKQFKYYHSPRSKQIGLFNVVDEIQTRINLIIMSLTTTPDDFQKELKNMMPDTFYDGEDHILVANKCMIAYEVFKKLKDLSGDTLANAVTSLFKDIDFKGVKTIEGEVQTSAKSKAKSRAAGKSDLIEFIKNEYALIIKVFQEMGYDYSEANLVKTINTKYGGYAKLNAMQAKLSPMKLWFDTLNEMVELMKAAQMTPHRISTAAYLYYESGKSEDVLKEYVTMSHMTAIGISEAIKFFGSFKKSNPIIRKAIKQLQNYVGSSNNSSSWKKHVHKSLTILNTSQSLVDGFYKFCLQTKRSNSGLKLVKVNTSLNDFIDGLGLEHITVVNGKLTHK